MDNSGTQTGTPYDIKKSRMIYLSGDVNEEQSKSVIKDILELEVSNPQSDIVLYIDSPGGYVDSFIAMHDFMKLCRCDIATVCMGRAMSCGMLLLISGTKGKRFITPNSRVLVHAISSWSGGNVHQLDNDIKETKRLQELLEGLIKRYTNMSSKKIKELMFKDSYLDANSALNFGIVDHIIYKSSDLHSHIRV